MRTCLSGIERLGGSDRRQGLVAHALDLFSVQRSDLHGVVRGIGRGHSRPDFRWLGSRTRPGPLGEADQSVIVSGSLIGNQTRMQSTAALGIVDVDLAAMLLDDAADDVHAEPAARSGTGAPEPAEDPLPHLLGDAGPVVVDLERDPAR